MKKIIYISGIVTVNVMLFGAIFKVMHWPGANILLTLAIFLFCFWFLPVALINSYKSQETRKYKWLYIVSFIVFFINMIGAIFKIMHWPGAGWSLIIALPLPFVLFLPVYLYQTRNDKKNTLNIMGIMFGLTFVAVFSALLAVNINREILNSINADITANEQFSTLIVQGKEGLKNDVTIKSDKLYDYIENIKDELLTASGNPVSKNESKDRDFQGFINNADNTDIAYLILYRRNGVGEIPALKTKITEYKNSLLSMNNINSDLKDLVSSLFDTSDKIIYDNVYLWESRIFQGNHLVVVIEALTSIQKNIRFVESELLSD